MVNIQAKLPDGAIGRVNPATDLIREWLGQPRLKALLAGSTVVLMPEQRP